MKLFKYTCGYCSTNHCETLPLGRNERTCVCNRKLIVERTHDDMIIVHPRLYTIDELNKLVARQLDDSLHRQMLNYKRQEENRVLAIKNLPWWKRLFNKF